MSRRLLPLAVALVALPLVAVFGLSFVAPAEAGAPKLFGTTGPGYTIVLKDAAGRAVTRVKAGRYVFVIKDRSSADDIHNFHLTGPGVDMRTGLEFVGTKTWSVKVARDKTYRFICDPHAFVMKGSFRST